MKITVSLCYCPLRHDHQLYFRKCSPWRQQSTEFLQFRNSASVCQRKICSIAAFKFSYPSVCRFLVVGNFFFDVNNDVITLCDEVIYLTKKKCMVYLFLWAVGSVWICPETYFFSPIRFTRRNDIFQKPNF